jgi:hypothetical protein
MRLFQINSNYISTKVETAGSVSPPRSGFSSRVLHVGYVVDGVVLGPVFL